MEATALSAPTGTRLTRTGRHSLPHQYYHLITCTSDRQPLFDSLYAGRQVVASLRRLEREAIATTLAYVVMPDHVHWLMQLGKHKTLPVCVGTMKSFAARNILDRLSRRGAVWQRGYVDRAIREERDLVRVARYIVANPLRAGIVDRIGDYPLWDSVWVDDSA